MSHELVAAARSAREQAYAPYSGFAVGAAVRASSGVIYSGCNVENASYGLSMCAERIAVFNALASGEHEISGLAVVSGPGATPCGACCQVLSEFTPCPEVLSIIVVNGQGDERCYTLQQLLPAPFSGESLSQP